MDPDSDYPKNPPIGSSAPIGGGGRKNDKHQNNNQKRRIVVVDSSREAALPNSTRRVAHQQKQSRGSNKQRGNTHDDDNAGGRGQQQYHSSSHYNKHQMPSQSSTVSKVHKSYEEGHHHSSRRSDRNYKEHVSSSSLQHYKTREKDDRDHRRNKDDRHTRDDRELHKSSSLAAVGYQKSSRRSSRNSNKEGRDNNTKHHYQLRDSFTSEGSISDYDNHHPKNDRYKSSKSKSRIKKEKGDIPKDDEKHSKQQQQQHRSSSFTSGEESISEEEHSANDIHHRHYRGGKEIKPVVEVDINYDDIVDGNGETLDDADLHVNGESDEDDDTIEIEYHTEDDEDGGGGGGEDANVSEGEERHDDIMEENDDDIGFDEEIEEANYTTTANKGSDVDDSSDFDELHHQEVVEGERRGYYAEEGRGREITSSPIHNKEDPVQQQQRNFHHHVGSNSPELNLNRRQVSNEDGLCEMKMPFDAAAATGDTTEGDDMMPTDIVLHHEQTQTKPSYDPPTKETEDMTAVRNMAMDPKFDDSTLYSRFDAPPSLSGPERAEQENQLEIVQEDLHGMTIIHSSGSFRGQDPPESGRGCDPKALSGTNDPPPSSASSPPRSSNKYRGGSSSNGGGGGGSKGSRSRTSGKSSRTSKDRINNKKEKKEQKPEIKGILKKKGAPIPITQFGKPLLENDDGNNNDSNDSESVGSDPDMIESKQSAPTTTIELSSSNHEKDDDAKSLGTTKSGGGGLRAGKYATVNAMAAWKNDTETENDSDDYYSMKTEDFYSNNKESTNNDGNATYITDYDNNTINCDYKSAAVVDDETTLKSISTNTNDRFDRSKSHFMRTSDLGLTQDTIFAEQFLDDLNSKAEPHYHCPSLHPPPGVQFHIDENWVCLDDGKGSHSPIAPQAVDALVAMGYRAACDPMMWTPSSKTRKYMTEKGLRFDDIPIPGPLDEGEGSPGDSNAQTWSGKFPHKYHGHEQPAIRSQGIVNMSPEELVDLLMDSNRVSEYNKSSIGRVDEVVLSDGTDLDSCPFSGQRKKKLTGVVMQGAKIVDGTATFDSETDDEQSDDEEIIEETFDDHGGKSVRTIMTSSSKRERRQSKFVGVTKLVRTTNKPPLVRKVLEFFTLLNCRALTDDQGGDGYIIVGRGITPAADVDSDKKNVMHSEILLNVHIIRRLRTSKEKKSSREKGRKGSSSRSAKSVSTSGRKASKSDLANRCLMINVNHMKSPLVPNMLAKKVGLSAALNFMMDIRALTE